MLAYVCADMHIHLLKYAMGMGVGGGIRPQQQELAHVQERAHAQAEMHGCVHAQHRRELHSTLDVVIDKGGALREHRCL